MEGDKAMSNVKRQDQILRLLQEHKSIEVNYIAQTLGVTPTTIRRDLIHLEEEKLITRSRGFANLVEHLYLSDFNIRKNLQADEKKRLAKAAASLISHGDSIILDSGTTMLALAQQMKPSDLSDSTVVSSSIPIVSVLASKCQVMMPGGILHDASMTLIGPSAEAYFHSIHADKAFVGSTGVRGTIGLTAASPYHVSLKKSMIAAASQVIAIIDSSKFSAQGLNLFCEFREVDTIITTHTEENAKRLEEITQLGVTIMFA